ncbi:MAG: hypothetical protein QJR12_09500 [Mycobacterium sp.]|uniref:hypothetical protein n=1 Tax=Mycobacterium sp. TaxID=1785 RepID=UPI00263A0AAA|nr:hypothetical protein [Mycobacterium sp.]MDI3314495.1 hypothetical protein [Mycobacterium sp.]
MTETDDFKLLIHPDARFRSTCALLRVADHRGRLHDFYGPGRLLPQWVAHDAEQIRRLLDHGLVEVCDAAGRPTDPGRVIECLSALSAVGVPLGCGRPRAADMLRRNGFRYSNDAIAKALTLFNSDPPWRAGDPFPWEAK